MAATIAYYDLVHIQMHIADGMRVQSEWHMALERASNNRKY